MTDELLQLRVDAEDLVVNARRGDEILRERLDAVTRGSPFFTTPSRPSND